MFTVKLSDGKEIKNLSKNGTCFVSTTKIELSTFENNLSEVTVIDSKDKDTPQILRNVKLPCITQIHGMWLFDLIEKTEEELEKEKMLSDLNAASSDITDIQEALVDIYEQIIGG